MFRKSVLALPTLPLFAIALCLQPRNSCAQPPAGSLGAFDGQSDVGSVTPPGTLAFDPASNMYTITAAGANIWLTEDAFHFVWKKVSGDFSLTADITFPDSSGNPNPHRKAVLMFRQTLDANSAYADAALHGSGLTSLQYRQTVGATTQEIQSNIDSPQRLRLEKRGDVITMFLSTDSEPLHQVGASIKLHFEGPFYAGIGVCSHNAGVVEKATFSNVELKALTSSAVPSQKAHYSTLQTIGTQEDSRDARVLTTLRGHMEAPIWTRDGKALIFNRDGRMYTIPAEGGASTLIDTGAATNCGGSHGLSPDGKWLAISCSMPDRPETRVYIVPSGGGTPRLVTENPASYFHSWSPDGKIIAFTRPSHGSGNIYSISVDGGAETALTTGNAMSDDPDYSADGKYIYFNSDRAGGTMQIWRMHADGSQPEQVTHDDFNNWTPHPSPDGKSILILSYDKGITGHPANNDIALRILDASSGKIWVLVNLIGGSGTDNVPCWAPDSAHVAFVSYQMLPVVDNGSSE